MTDQLLSNTPPSRFSFLKTKRAIAVGIGIAIIAVGSLVWYISYSSQFAAPQTNAELEQFTMPLGSGDFKDLSALLKEKGFIKSEAGFKIAYFKTNGIGITATTCVDCFTPGAYRISKSMTAWQVAETFKEGPYMKWVVIPEGLRKEQIADILANQLGWNEDVEKKWVTTYTSMNYDEIEGLYFPDPYLIPVDEEPLKVADRLRAKFNEKFQPYTQEALKQNIKWTTALKLASIVQREAAGKDDMPLIAGILWNRLLKDMKLEVDATVQYVRDDQIHYGEARYDKQPGTYTSEGTWWMPIKPEDIDIPSPYNTYRNEGLPPHPIANPGIDAIKAVLYPEETECMFYLHDKSKTIHCAETFEEHKANIATYLSD